jgi:hypothetical protein
VRGGRAKVYRKIGSTVPSPWDSVKTPNLNTSIEIVMVGPKLARNKREEVDLRIQRGRVTPDPKKKRMPIVNTSRSASAVNQPRRA